MPSMFSVMTNWMVRHTERRNVSSELSKMYGNAVRLINYPMAGSNGLTPKRPEETEA